MASLAAVMRQIGANLMHEDIVQIRRLVLDAYNLHEYHPNDPISIDPAEIADYVRKRIEGGESVEMILALPPYELLRELLKEKEDTR
jgi:hypothetical protein